MSAGSVYTETTIWSAPEQYVNDVPYQIAIVQLDEGERITGRMSGDPVQIGDRVEFLEYRDKVPFFRKSL